MADDAKPGPSEEGDDDSQIVEMLPGFKDVNAFSQGCLRALMMSIKHSNELPVGGEDYDFYSSFQSFRDVMDMEGRRILHMIQQLLRYRNIKGNVTETGQAVEIEDKFDMLVDANDQILETVGTLLDEASGLKKTEAPLVLVSNMPKSAVSTSWNKKAQPKKTSTFRLLAARHIQRPQLKFKDKIDNCNTPFVPRLRYKPHALRALEESMPSYYGDEEFNRHEDNRTYVYPHPYQYELEHLTYLPQQSEKVEVTLPPNLENTPLTFIENASDLAALCDVLKEQKEFAVDLEHHSYRTFQGITCLMQISTRTQDYVIDTLLLRSDLCILNEVFADPKIVKVFHGADSDIQWLQQDLGLYVVNMFDTGQASRVLNMSRFSLAFLLLHYCQLEVDKQFQLADWRIRPLPEELVKYAREDTHYLLYLYDRMKNDLLESGNEQKNLLMSVLSRSTQVCQKVYKKPIFSEQEYMELYRKSKKVLNSQQLQALKDVYAWRDKMARSEDESIGYVLPNHMLLQMCELLPREAQGILACCNPIPPLVRQHQMELHRILTAARETPLVKMETAKVDLKPSRLEHPKYSTDKLLNCQHDWSHTDKGPDVNNHVDIATVNLDSNLVANESSMFGKSTPVSVQVKSSPIITAFSLTSQEFAGDRPKSAAQEKAEKIWSSFISPFDAYVPAPSNSSKTGTSKTNQILAKWRLLRNTTKKQKKVKIVPADGKESLSDKNAQPQVDASSNIITLREQTEKKSKKKKRKSDADLYPLSDEDEAEKEKKEDLTFEPFDYDKQDYKEFDEKSKKARKEYDPYNGEESGEKWKIARNPHKNKPSSGQTSVSFSANKKTYTSQQWPKR